ncbi:MAG: hypothetical protein AAB804_00345 [Patescibacteria group bacterium]
MYVIAIMGDLLSLIPFVNIVSSPLTAIALGIAGSHTGVSLYSSNRIGMTLLTILGEAVPIVSMIPLWTVRVYLAKKQEEREDASEV